MRSLLRALRLTAGISGAALLVACPDGSSPDPVASVQMTTTYSNPRVGETSNVTAKAVNEGGVEVPGVTCTFSSGNTAVATVVAASGVVTAVSVGTSAITATCGGKSNSITIRVRPRQYTLTINKTGAGSGAVFANPAGTTFDDGTVVSVTATANTGSTFNGWSGACTGKGACSVTMNADQTVTADFSDGEQFNLSANFGGSMTSVSDPSPPGCSYSVNTQLTAFSLLVKSATATGTSTASINLAVTGQTSAGTCSANSFSVTSTGTLTVTGNSISGTLVFFSNTQQKNTQTLTINATRNNTTITGTVSINQKPYNGSNVEFTSTGGPYTFTLTKVP